MILKIIPWIPGGKQENKKKHRLAMWMETKIAQKLFEDAVVSCKTSHQCDYAFNEMFRVINANDVVGGVNRFFVY